MKYFLLDYSRGHSFVVEELRRARLYLKSLMNFDKTALHGCLRADGYTFPGGKKKKGKQQHAFRHLWLHCHLRCVISLSFGKKEKNFSHAFICHAPEWCLIDHREFSKHALAVVCCWKRCTSRAATVIVCWRAWLVFFFSFGFFRVNLRFKTLLRATYVFFSGFDFQSFFFRLDREWTLFFGWKFAQLFVVDARIYSFSSKSNHNSGIWATSGELNFNSSRGWKEDPAPAERVTKRRSNVAAWIIPGAFKEELELPL